MNLARGVVAAVASLTVSASAAEPAYAVTVTRKADNLYRVDGKDIYILTRMCYEFAYSQKATLKWDGSFGTLIFKPMFETQTPPSCEVEIVLTRARL